MKPPPRLLAGLGNPGRRYLRTRHNAGLQFLEHLQQQLEPRPVKRFKGSGCLLEARLGATRFWLLHSGSYMNESGTDVARVRDQLQLSPEEMLIIHDDLDLPPGHATLKEGGGLGGHLGLQDITDRLHSQAYCRLRIGIGRPTDSSQVIRYVLQPPDNAQRALMLQAMESAAAVIPDVLDGRMQAAMRTLHTR